MCFLAYDLSLTEGLNYESCHSIHNPTRASINFLRESSMLYIRYSLKHHGFEAVRQSGSIQLWNF